MTDPGHVHSASDRRRLERPIWQRGLVISVVFHLAVFLAWRGAPIPTSPFAAAGPRSGDPREARGGGMQAVTLSIAPPQAIVRPPVPLAVSIEIEEVEVEELASVPTRSEISGGGTGSVPGAGAGTDSGVGRGDGRGDGGTGTTGLYRLQPATPRGMIIPPSDRSLRGTKVEVWVFVDEAGQVVPDSTRLSPPTKSRGFNQRLIREASEWVFRPAMQDGRPVASWFPYQISM